MAMPWCCFDKDRKKYGVELSEVIMQSENTIQRQRKGKELSKDDNN